jgi:hypothetical protein
MLADLDLLLTAVFCTADDLLPEKPGNARRRVTDAEVVALCVAQAMLGIGSDRHFLALCPRLLGHCPSSPASTSAGGAWPTRSSGLWAALPPTVRATTTIWCCLTRRRSSAGARSRPCAARSSPMPLATATAARTRAGLGNAAASLGRSRRDTARRDPRPGRPEGARGRAAAVADRLARRRDDHRGTRAMPGASSSRPFRSASAPRCCAPAGPTSPARGRTSPHSVSASSRSSGRSKIGSGSSCTAHARSSGSARASQPSSSRSPPRSGSTTNTAARRERSPRWQPKTAWNQSSSRRRLLVRGGRAGAVRAGPGLGGRLPTTHREWLGALVLMAETTLAADESPRARAPHLARTNTRRRTISLPGVPRVWAPEAVDDPWDMWDVRTGCRDAHDGGEEPISRSAGVPDRGSRV